MITVLGTVKQNMSWIKEMDKLKLDEPKRGSVRLNLSTLIKDKTVYNCDYSKGEFISNVPTLEIIYQVGAALTERLKSGDLVELNIYNNSIYHKTNHFEEIQEVPNGQIKFYHLKVGDHKIDNFRYVDCITPPRHLKRKTVSAEELIDLLIKLPSNELPQLTLPVITKPILELV